MHRPPFAEEDIAIPGSLPWKRITVAAILVAELVVLALAAWSARSAPADGIVVRPDDVYIGVSNQKAVTSRVRIDRVVAPGPSWVVVQADNGAGEPGRVLGTVHVEKGESTDVDVAVEAVGLPRVAVATLFSDRGVVGKFEYSGSAGSDGMGGGSTPVGADKPYVADGKVVSAQFAIEPLSFRVSSGEATIGAVVVRTQGTSVIASDVVAPGQSWLSVSVVATNGAPGQVLGFTAVQAGVNPTVTVMLPAATTSRPLVVMLHADLGRSGKFDYSAVDASSSPDQPYVAGGRTVRIPIPPAR